MYIGQQKQFEQDKMDDMREDDYREQIEAREYERQREDGREKIYPFEVMNKIGDALFNAARGVDEDIPW